MAHDGEPRFRIVDWILRRSTTSPRCWARAAGVLGWLALAGLKGAAVEARPHPLDRALDAHDRYAIAAGARIRIGAAAVVEGNVHSNDTIELRKESRVTGEVSAVKEIRNQGGSVIGPVIQRAAAVALPAMPGKSEARALADRALAGPLKLIDPRIDDVLFVAGAVTIAGAAQGAGTLIATGTVAVTAGGAGAPPPPTDSRLAVSRRAKSGHSSRSHDCVGTPTKLVMRSRSISSSAREGSHLCIITSL
jgi:hypothetical protein